MRNELENAQCVAYQRISWSEQSTYSLSAQERTNGDLSQEIPVSSPYGNNIEHFFTLAQILQGLAA